MNELLNAENIPLYGLQEMANIACKHMPEGYELRICMENGSAWVELTKDFDATNVGLPDAAGKTLLEQVNDAICVANGWSI